MGISLGTLPTPDVTNGAWGDDINAALQGLSDMIQYKLKTVDENLASNTTLQDDDALASLTLPPGTWEIEVVLFVAGAAAGDIKVAWAFSGTTSVANRGGQGPTINSTSVVNAAAATTVGVNRSAGAGDTTTAIASATPYGTDGTNLSMIFEKGMLVVTGSGTFKIQWAQNTSSVTNTTVKAGSYVKAIRVV